MLNLYAVYKSLQQRASRAINVSQAKKANKLVVQMKLILEKPTLKNAQKLNELEERYFGNSKNPMATHWFSPGVIDAIRNNDYFVKRPHVNQNGASGYNPDVGYIYVAESTSKRGVVKIGITEDYEPQEVRIPKFRSKFGIKDLRSKGFLQVQSPLQIEREVSYRLGKFSVKNGKNESNEWYSCPASKAQRVLVEAALDMNLKILKSTWIIPEICSRPNGSWVFERLLRSIFDLEPHVDISPARRDVIEALLLEMLDSLPDVQRAVIDIQFGLKADGQMLSIDETARRMGVYSRWARGVSLAAFKSFEGSVWQRALRNNLGIAES